MCYSGEHLPPHVHVFYNGKEVLIDLVKLNVYAGSLPSRPLKKVIQLVVEHQADFNVSVFGIKHTFKKEVMRVNNKSFKDPSGSISQHFFHCRQWRIQKYRYQAIFPKHTLREG